jgi:hypothetical protein
MSLPTLVLIDESGAEATSRVNASIEKATLDLESEVETEQQHVRRVVERVKEENSAEDIVTWATYALAEAAYASVECHYWATTVDAAPSNGFEFVLDMDVDARAEP